MSCLLDTNVLSELRKGVRANAGVQAWFASVSEAEIYTSVLVVGELRRGIASLGRRDPVAALALEHWLARWLAVFDDRVLPVDREVAERWGPLNVPDRLPTVDGVLAATALVHDLTLVTRNVRDVAGSGVRVLNPFVPT